MEMEGRMAMGQRRKRRLESNLKREISRIVRWELELPRGKLLTVTDVDLTADFKQATVYVSHMVDEPDVRRETLKRLRREEKTVRAGITRALPLKHIPEMRFREDDSIKKAAEINDIARQLRREREQRHQQDDA